jgi:hypothetical protein
VLLCSDTAHQLRRRFLPPWSIEELNDACVVVRDANGQALTYTYIMRMSQGGQ